MIYTGYFYKLNDYINAGLVPISICGKSPDFYSGLEYKKLAPKYSFFMAYKNKFINSEQYTEQYKQQVLSYLEKEQVVQELQTLVREQSKDADIVLLCYEKPGDFCHRHIVAEWLSDIYAIQEFTNFSENADERTKDFEKAAGIGLIGEDVFIKYITENLKEGSVLCDVRSDKYYQEKDIDFIIENAQEAQVRTIEVKTETTIGNNITVVCWKDIHKQKKGWIQVTEADYIFLYKQQLNKAFLIKTNVLKKYVESLQLKDLELLYAKSPRQAWGYVISLKDLEKNNAILKVINF